jgi:hypothetical protein
MMLFALVDPGEGDDHKLFVDRLLMSPGTENYKLAPAPERESTRESVMWIRRKTV